MYAIFSDRLSAVFNVVENRRKSPAGNPDENDQGIFLLQKCRLINIQKLAEKSPLLLRLNFEIGQERPPQIFLQSLFYSTFFKKRTCKK